MTPFDYCERKTIDVVTTQQMMKKPAWVYQELAVHEAVGEDGYSVITHLPTGLRMGDNAYFIDMEVAVKAMMEISSISNSWAFTDDKNLKDLGIKTKEICRKFGGLVLHSIGENIKLSSLGENYRGLAPKNGIEVTS